MLLSAPHPQVEDVFAGRAEELRVLSACLLPADRRRRPVVVSGMGGVGKSYLVDRFYTQHDGTFPGGYILLAVDPETPGSGGELLTQIADRLKLPPADAAGLVARLQAPLTLLHVENVDTDERPPPSVLWRCACAAARWWRAHASPRRGRHRLPAAPAAGRTRPQPVGPGRGNRTDDRVVLRKAA